MLKLELLKFELLEKMKMLFLKLFLLMKLIVLTLLPTNLSNPKKYRRDAMGVACLGGMTERRRKLEVMGAPARSTWADHRLPDIRSRKPAR